MLRYKGTRLSIALIMTFALSLVSSTVRLSFASTQDDWITESGDAIMWLLPVTALTGTAIMKDWEGMEQFAYSTVTSVGSVTVMKRYFGKMRPDSVEARNSFPSGHAAGAFSGAAFINTRYGKGWGIPAFALAFFTAYSRVHADRHFVDDVTAGASVALFSNWGFVTPYQSPVSVEPVVLEGGYGLKVNIAERAGSPSTRRKENVRRRHRYEMQFGPAYLRKNEITAPSAAGTAFDLNDFNKVSDPTTTAAVQYSFFPGERRALTLAFAPFESRDSSTFASPVVFQGNSYTGTVGSAYRMYDMRVQYAYDLSPEREPWIINAGAALAVQYLSFELTGAAAGTPASAVTDWSFLPLVYVKLGYYLSKRLHLDLDSSGIALSDDRHYDGGLILTYDIDDHWNAGVGYRYFDRKIETSKLRNEVSYDITVFSLAYAW